MLPLVVAEQLQATLLDYLKTTWALADATTEAALLDFLRAEDGLFRGPFVDVRLPFRSASAGDQGGLDVHPAFRPYAHQVQAFRQLSSVRAGGPVHTLVTTGTGSGKTECFLFPVLDHCWRHRDAPGVKALLLYPMNALATDQSRRIAELIHGDERLRGAVRAGIFIGGEGEGHGEMGEDFLIDRKDVLRRDPPDILLTNYKMLDFLLMRPEDKALWRHSGPGTLRHLVLDELHTYDGAQGSDVACLIRRLRARFGVAPGALTCVGTSATIGSRADGKATLVAFASKLFAEPFDAEHVVTEDRVAHWDFIPEPPSVHAFPDAADPEVAARLDPDASADADAFVRDQARLWFPDAGDVADDPVALGDALRRHGFLLALLDALGGQLREWRDLDGRLAVDERYARLAPLARWRLVSSFLALVARARRLSAPGSTFQVPFLTVQVQLWTREIHHLLAQVPSLGEDGLSAPRFAWSEDVAGDDSRGAWAPVAYCRECGANGFAAVLREGDAKLSVAPSTAGQAWFDGSRYARFVQPVATTDGSRRDGELLAWRCCPRCLALTMDKACGCEAPGVPTVPCRVSDATRGEKKRFRFQCTECGADDALSILGSRAASLSSVAVSHLYQSAYNDDRKLLAFTDSVQDASHRAGFFGARTYRFNLRAAIQGAAAAAGGHVALARLPQVFEEHWLARLGRTRFVATFLPPDLRELPAYVAFREDEKGRHTRLFDALRKRLSWEIVREYGLATFVGRTLELTASSTVAVDPEPVARVAERLAAFIREERLDYRGPVPVEAVRHFLDGFLLRQRQRGGIWHPFLDAYARAGGDRFLLSRKKNPLISPLPRRARAPRLLHDRSSDLDNPFAGIPNQTWYGDWLGRALGMVPDRERVGAIYGRALQLLAEAGVLHAVSSGAGTAWGLSPNALTVHTAVGAVRCAQCARQVALPAEAVNRWEGRACPQFRCQGRLARAEVTPGYYTRFYATGRLHRIFSAEHTGLLERDDREALERRFKEGSDPDAPNLLVCTPTLEMGIDIGDLSATMLCSVPPTTANYLQRVGRAGRKTGNALCLTLANSAPHDLYFHARPREMLAGEVTPPGAYLEAPEMLKRQMVAHAMDTWSAEQEELKNLPAKAWMGLGKTGEQGFPGRFLAWYGAHAARVTARFLRLFGGEIGEERAALLRAFGQSDAIPTWVREAFAALEATLADLGRQRAAMRKRLQEIEADPGLVADPQAEIDELKRAIRLIERLRDEVRETYMLNVLTDASVLPNYAFPEPGVRLQSMLREPPGVEGDGKKPTYRKFEYIRPAATALRELAPFNTFYAEGHKVRVSEVYLGQKGDLIESWRLCPKCHHQERDLGGPPKPACPRCEDLAWADTGQVRAMVPFRIARSMADMLDAATVDDADERETYDYWVSDVIDVGLEHVDGGATVIEGLPFGWEYLRDLTLRQVNFGPRPGDGSHQLKVAGFQVPEAGFVVCRECARAWEPGAKELAHAPWCSRKKGTFAPDNVNLFLYRQVRSEAIRLLLPIADVEVEAASKSFKAALELGFRKKFQGRPIHLAVREVSEPVEGELKLRRRYLVVYDVVPGGTGYLRDLCDPKKDGGVFGLLELARDALRSCPCRGKGHDGCYRCIYAYQSQLDLGVISSTRAQHTLDRILGARDEAVHRPTLAKVSLAQRLESELELKFVNALLARSGTIKDFRAQRSAWKGAECWELAVGEHHWRMEAQVELGPKDGVRIPTRPDFVLRCLTRPDARPVAVYCDGYEYHVRPGQPLGGIVDDLAKRAALIAAGWVVWSVTWRDVEHFEGATAPAPLALGGVDRAVLGKVLERVGVSDLAGTVERQAIDLLLAWLSAPDAGRWAGLARGILAALATQAMVRRQPCNDEAGLDRLEDHLDRAPAMHPMPLPALVATPGRVVGWVHAEGALVMLARIPVDATKRGDMAAARAVLRLDDTETLRAEKSTFEPAWRAFLQAWNLLQFHDGVDVTTTERVASGGAEAAPVEEAAFASLALVADPATPDASEPTTLPPAIADLAALCSGPVFVELLKLAHRNGLPLPSVGEEIPDVRGRTLANAELAWMDRKVAIATPSAMSEQDAERARALGWTVLFPPVALGDLVGLLE